MADPKPRVTAEDEKAAFVLSANLGMVRDPERPGWLDEKRKRIALFRAEARAEERERAAQYIETHYPARVTAGGKAFWEMAEEPDGGKIQSLYAAAIRGGMGDE